MNLFENYKSLIPPNTGDPKVINAVSLPEHSFLRLGINNECYPIGLLTAGINRGRFPQKNVRLKYIEINYDAECNVFENETAFRSTFVIITLLSGVSVLQHYFLEVMETFINTLSQFPTRDEIANKIETFLEVFKSISAPPTKSVRGLWSELFLISVSRNPTGLLNYWHENPEEKFDFFKDSERIEVKSSKSHQHIHYFSAEQLNPPIGKKVIIASVLLKNSTDGANIPDLIDLIKGRVYDYSMTQKMFRIVYQTLGSSLEQSLEIRFDSKFAIDSLQFYDSEDVHKIEKIYIPEHVSEVHYKSDLSYVPSISVEALHEIGDLFRSL